MYYRKHVQTQMLQDTETYTCTQYTCIHRRRCTKKASEKLRASSTCAASTMHT